MKDESQEFWNYLVAIGAVRDCPACGNQAWGVMDKTNDSAPAITFFPVLGDIAGIGIETLDTTTIVPVPFFIVGCNVCGYMRYHMKFPFENWRRKQQEGKQ